MARKDVDEYYNIISAQYAQLLEELSELEKDETIPEDIIEDVKRDIDIVKTNRDRWVYMIYLLNRPARKKKAERYDKIYQNKALNEEQTNSIDYVIDENQEVLDNIEEYL